MPGSRDPLGDRDERLDLLSRALRALDRGETFVVTRNGVPVGELTPLRQRRFVGADAAAALFAAAPIVDGERLRADVDAVLDQQPAPRG